LAAETGGTSAGRAESTVSPSMRPPDQLTSGEQRLFCVVIARLVGREHARVDADAATIAAEDVIADRVDALREAARAFGGRLETISEGALVVPLEGRGAATDQASRAARCALVMR